MFCTYTRPRYQVSVYRTIGPLVQNLYNKNRHCAIYGVDSWSGVLEWSHGVEFGVDFGVE